MDDETAQYLGMYKSEAEEHIQTLQLLVELEKDPNNTEIISKIFRAAHTLKSMSATMGFNNIAELMHEMENLFDYFRSGGKSVPSETFDVLFQVLDIIEKQVKAVSEGENEGDLSAIMGRLKELEQKVKEGKVSGIKGGAGAEKPDGKISEPQAPKAAEPVVEEVQSIKVPVARLDTLMSLVGELVTITVQLKGLQQKHGVDQIADAVVNLDQVTSKTREEVMQIRMIPIGQVFNRFPRLVRDVAKQEDKRVNFVMSGGETELDRTVLDKLGDPLVHLLKNAVDHGLESTEERRKAGKPEEGTVKLMAKRERNVVNIVVEDDGGGIDVETIKKVAVKKGVATADEVKNLEDMEAIQLMFRSGFSTSEKVSEISGRGVGLNAVKSMIQSVGGTVAIESEKGKFTRFILQVPLSIAIVQSLMVMAEGELYCIPIANVRRIIKVEKNNIKTIEGMETIIEMDEDVSLVFLRRLFGLKESDASNYTAVIIERGKKKTAVVVDEVVGKNDITIKPLGKMVEHAKFFAGSSIMADGGIAMVLDVGSILR